MSTRSAGTTCRPLTRGRRWPSTLPELNYPDRLNCAVELLDAVIDRLGPDRPCLLTPDGTALSYGDLRRDVNRIASVLTTRLGLVPGNRVLLRGPNNPWLAACWLGVVKAGGVVVSTMPLLRPAELTTVAEIAEVNLALCDERFVTDLQRADLRGAPIVTDRALAQLTDAAAGEFKAGEFKADEFKADEFTAVDTAADDVVMLAFTSGTTGRPKATMHFHRDVLAIADTFSAHLVKPTPDDVFIGTPPLAFTFGLGGLLVFPLRAGAATLLLEKATPDELADAIERHRATVCFTAPTAYRAMLRAGRAESLRGLRRAVSAGEHLPESTWRDFYAADRRPPDRRHRLDRDAARLRLGRRRRHPARRDRQGRPRLRGGDPRRRRQAGAARHARPAGREGPDRLPLPRRLPPGGVRANGWNFTGDTFLVDEDGYFYYLARKDDMIISSGYNIAGPEVEEAMAGHPAVVECCVVGVPDEERGQLVKAFVVLADGVIGSPLLVAELQDFAKRTIAPYKYPRAIEFIDALPRTSTGKVQRYVLRQVPT